MFDSVQWSLGPAAAVLYALATAGSAAAQSVTADEPLSPQTVAARYSRSVVLVIAELADGRTSQGTGFAADSQGSIATSLHVIEGARRVVVRTADRESHELTVIQAYDIQNDLVVIHTDGANLTPVQLGDSAELRIGDPLVVIGNPLGLTGSVTQGILSARRHPDPEGTDEAPGTPRRLMVDLPDCELLQLSAAAAPGSSGAPVFDAAGSVVGIQRAGVFEGALDLNFAIPVEALIPLLGAHEGLDLASLRERLDAERRSRAQEHFDNARFAFEQEDFDTAELELERALTLFPRYVEALLLRGRLLVRKGDFGQARQALLEAAEVAGDSAAVWYALGEVCLQSGAALTPVGRQETRRYFETAWELENGHPGAAYGLGVLLLLESRFEEAIEKLEYATQSDPDLVAAGVMLGEAYLAKRRFSEAEKAFENVLWADSENARAHMGLGVVCHFTSQILDERYHWGAFFELAEGDPELAPLVRQAVEFLRTRRSDLIPDRYR